ncbi:MAG: hypothetical protein A2Z13_09170 [Deltaproteobacteria bacterium RBG_16_64_85]|nr:MAG: hypothetical protein A2Z13_09170 [Deltaproteobacteria bacterium RBG_16_64_85]
MEKIVSFVKRVVVLLGFLMALWLPIVASVHYLEMKKGKDLAEPMWITSTDGHRLMRYHGTNGLKITHDRVYIWRDSKWVPVLKRKQA